MVRDDIVNTLKSAPLSVLDLAKQFDRPTTAIEEDLEHIRISLRSEPYQLLISPAACSLCSFQFPAKVKTPTRCPECNREKIAPATFKIAKKLAK